MINVLGTCNHCWLDGEFYDEITSEFLCEQHAYALASHPENCECGHGVAFDWQYDPNTNRKAA